MKKTFILFLSFCCLWNAFAQQAKEGLYQSADGVAQFSLKNLDDSSIQVTETNMTSVYNKNGDSYQHSDARYSQYMMRVNAPTEIIAFKSTGGNETKYTWIGSTNLTEEDCPLGEKYQGLAEDDSNPEVQAYSFCAAAAMMKCSYTPEGFAAYAATITKTMKLIMVDVNKCPCTDVIPQSIWDAN